MKLTASELRTFAVVADAFFPALTSGRPLANGGSGIDRLSATELRADARLPELFARLPSDAALGVRAMLACLSNRAGGLVLFDRAVRFERLIARALPERPTPGGGSLAPEKLPYRLQPGFQARPRSQWIAPDIRTLLRVYGAVRGRWDAKSEVEAAFDGTV